MAAKLRKGDKVVVTTGKDKGKSGEITKVLTEEGQVVRVVVAGVNMVKRHTRPGAGSQGGIIEKEAAIAAANVAHIDPKTKKPTRIGFKTLKDGRKVRYAKKSGEVIDN